MGTLTKEFTYLAASGAGATVLGLGTAAGSLMINAIGLEALLSVLVSDKCSYSPGFLCGTAAAVPVVVSMAVATQKLGARTKEYYHMFREHISEYARY